MDYNCECRNFTIAWKLLVLQGCWCCKDAEFNKPVAGVAGVARMLLNVAGCTFPSGITAPQCGGFRLMEPAPAAIQQPLIHSRSRSVSISSIGTSVSSLDLASSSESVSSRSSSRSDGSSIAQRESLGPAAEKQSRSSSQSPSSSDSRSSKSSSSSSSSSTGSNRSGSSASSRSRSASKSSTSSGSLSEISESSSGDSEDDDSPYMRGGSLGSGFLPEELRLSTGLRSPGAASVVSYARLMSLSAQGGLALGVGVDWGEIGLPPSGADGRLALVLPIATEYGDSFLASNSNHGHLMGGTSPGSLHFESPGPLPFRIDTASGGGSGSGSAFAQSSARGLVDDVSGSYVVDGPFTTLQRRGADGSYQALQHSGLAVLGSGAGLEAGIGSNAYSAGALVQLGDATTTMRSRDVVSEPTPRGAVTSPRASEPSHPGVPSAGNAGGVATVQHYPAPGASQSSSASAAYASLYYPRQPIFSPSASTSTAAPFPALQQSLKGVADAAAAGGEHSGAGTAGPEVTPDGRMNSFVAPAALYSAVSSTGANHAAAASVSAAEPTAPRVGAGKGPSFISVARYLLAPPPSTVGSRAGARGASGNSGGATSPVSSTARRSTDGQRRKSSSRRPRAKRRSSKAKSRKLKSDARQLLPALPSSDGHIDPVSIDGVAAVSVSSARRRSSGSAAAAAVLSSNGIVIGSRRTSSTRISAPASGIAGAAASSERGVNLSAATASFQQRIAGVRAASKAARAAVAGGAYGASNILSGGAMPISAPAPSPGSLSRTDLKFLYSAAEHHASPEVRDAASAIMKNAMLLDARAALATSAHERIARTHRWLYEMLKDAQVQASAQATAVRHIIAIFDSGQFGASDLAASAVSGLATATAAELSATVGMDVGTAPIRNDENAMKSDSDARGMLPLDALNAEVAVVRVGRAESAGAKSDTSSNTALNVGESHYHPASPQLPKAVFDANDNHELGAPLLLPAPTETDTSHSRNNRTIVPSSTESNDAASAVATDAPASEAPMLDMVGYAQVAPLAMRVSEPAANSNVAGDRLEESVVTAVEGPSAAKGAARLADAIPDELAGRNSFTAGESKATGARAVLQRALERLSAASAATGHQQELVMQLRAAAQQTSRTCIMPDYRTELQRVAAVAVRGSHPPSRRGPQPPWDPERVAAAMLAADVRGSARLRTSNATRASASTAALLLSTSRRRASDAVVGAPRRRSRSATSILTQGASRIKRSRASKTGTASRAATSPASLASSSDRPAILPIIAGDPTQLPLGATRRTLGLSESSLNVHHHISSRKGSALALVSGSALDARSPNSRDKSRSRSTSPTTSQSSTSSSSNSDSDSKYQRRRRSRKHNPLNLHALLPAGGQLLVLPTAAVSGVTTASAATARTRPPLASLLRVHMAHIGGTAKSKSSERVAAVTAAAGDRISKLRKKRRASSHYTDKRSLERRKRLREQRDAAVVDTVQDLGVAPVVEVGCEATTNAMSAVPACAAATSSHEGTTAADVVSVQSPPRGPTVNMNSLALAGDAAASRTTEQNLAAASAVRPLSASAGPVIGAADNDDATDVDPALRNPAGDIAAGDVRAAAGGRADRHDVASASLAITSAAAADALLAMASILEDPRASR